MAQSETPPDRHPLATAREVPHVFWPDHKWHTVVLYKTNVKMVELTCDCGQGGLRVWDGEAKAKGLNGGIEEVKRALRNVPVEAKKKASSIPVP